MATITPHPAHSVRSAPGDMSVRSVDGIVNTLAEAEWMDEGPDGASLPPLSMEATVAAAVAMGDAAGEAAAPIDADLVPDPVASRTNSNITVEASAGSASAPSTDAYLLEGIDDDDDM